MGNASETLRRKVEGVLREIAAEKGISPSDLSEAVFLTLPDMGYQLQVIQLLAKANIHLLT